MSNVFDSMFGQVAGPVLMRHNGRAASLTYHPPTGAVATGLSAIIRNERSEIVDSTSGGRQAMARVVEVVVEIASLANVSLNGAVTFDGAKWAIVAILERSETFLRFDVARQEPSDRTAPQYRRPIR